MKLNAGVHDRSCGTKKLFMGKLYCAVIQSLVTAVSWMDFPSLAANMKHEYTVQSVVNDLSVKNVHNMQAVYKMKET